MRTLPAAIEAALDDRTYRAMHLLEIRGWVASIAVTNGGAGYSSAPAVSIAGGSGLGAVASATINAGQVTAVTVVLPGAGYGSVPTVSFSGGGGAGAAATASIAGVYRWTDAPFEISYGGNAYVQQAFSVGDVVIDDDDNQAVELTVFDVAQVVRGLLWNEDWSYRPTTLREVWLNEDLTVKDAYIVADGRADAGVLNFEDASEPVTIAILPETEAEGAPGPAQRFEGSCRYLGTSGFKGIQCGYAGAETTCDGTMARCDALGNKPRYGGFPYAPAAGSTIRVGYGATAVTVGTRSRAGED